MAVTIMTSWQLVHFAHMMHRFVCHVSQVHRCRSYHEAIMVTGESACCIKIIHVLCSPCVVVISSL